MEGGEHGQESSWDCVVTPSLRWKKCPDTDEEWLNDYVVLQELGSGSFSRVRLCERRVGEPPYRKFAIKMLSKPRLRGMSEYVNVKGKLTKVNAQNRVWKEISIMRHLYHRNVAILFEVLDDPEEEEGAGGFEPHLCMVMEYLAGGPTMAFESAGGTSRFVARSRPGGVWDEGSARPLFRDLCTGLMYLHQDQRVAHRDIKPDNLMLHEKGTLRIADYGCAAQFNKEEAARGGGPVHDTAGAFAFQSPEAITAKMEGYGAFAADVWAAGVTLYTWIFGDLPFMAEEVEGLFEAIRSETLDLGEALSVEIRTLLLRLFDKNPATRITLRECLASDWLKGIPPSDTRV
jgi:[calcium/calmodulin-dependent protein kinase] kinase